MDIKKIFEYIDQTNKVMDKAYKNLQSKAKDLGLAEDYLYLTTLQRYQMTLLTMSKYEKVIWGLGDDELIVTKKYSNSENSYQHPAVLAYGKNVDLANKTVSTILKIFRNADGDVSREDSDPLMSALNGDEDDEQ